MPHNCTTSWSLFPPKTDEVPFDEKWAFVGKKQKNCDPADARCGDCWDHVALDPESRLVVSRSESRKLPATGRAAAAVSHSAPVGSRAPAHRA